MALMPLFFITVMKFEQLMFISPLISLVLIAFPLLIPVYVKVLHNSSVSFRPLV